MRDISAKDCTRLRQELSGTVSLQDALPRIIGETQVGGGLWRFFSTRYPDGGIAQWNSMSTWMQEWRVEPTQLYAIGEDLFGNQLIVRPGSENVHLWNHENGSVVDLLLAPMTLLETIVESGIDWIDFYGNGALEIAVRRLMDVPLECHLHWTTPLIMGGQVGVENTSVIERSMHLIGHAKLWAQLCGLDLGNSIVPTRKS